MPRRLRVLISAYACEPGKGSEPEVGWQWALQMARFHDVTVLTRANNRGPIEQALPAFRERQPVPAFVYHDESPFLLEFKRSLRATTLYYILWQNSVREIIARLHKARRFDLLHHVTFAAFRYPAAIWGHGVPCIWGPIGGIESIPVSLLPWSHPRSLIHEAVRNVHNLVQATPFPILPRRASATTLILASTPDMRDILAKHNINAALMPTIGLRTSELPVRPHSPPDGSMRLLFVGGIITLKGVDLALRAFQQARVQATLTFVGDGDFLPAARRLVEKLGLADRVFFPGRLPRSEVLRLYPDFDLLLYPSLHDTGSYSVIEAMLNGLPVICLDCGGPSLAVRQGCGIKVPVGSRSDVIEGLAEAIRTYDRDRSRLAQDGQTARKAVLENYDWDKKGEQMNDLYQKAAAPAPNRLEQVENDPYSGLGGSTRFLSRMMSLKGMVIAMVSLLIVGSLGFLSLSRLKHVANEIVQDTLPGLAYAGEANAHLADGYRTLLIVTSDNPAQRAEIRREMERLTQRTTDYLAKYDTQIFSPEDRADYVALLESRKQFLDVRDKIINLAEAGRRQEAMVLFHQSLVPLQARVKTAGGKLLEFNMNECESRGRSIMAICSATQVFVAVVVIALFVLGFFIGLSK